MENLLPSLRERLLEKLSLLEANPFPEGKKIKKIRGLKESIYRFRVDLPDQSYRTFYSIVKPDVVLLLRIVPKKMADHIINTLSNG